MNQPSAAVHPTPPATRDGGLAVLLVEDNELNQQLAQLLLQRWGHRVAVAANGVEALVLHAQARFDVILMDLQMPEMDGFEATAQIRARERLGAPRSVIIAMTASTCDGDRARCLAAGMDDYLSKPFRSEAFQQLLARHAGPPPPSPPAAPAVATTPFDYGAAMLAADPLTLSAIGRHFADALPGDLARLHGDWASADIEGLRRRAHSLCGLFASFGALPSVQAAAAIDLQLAVDPSTDAAPLLARLEREAARFGAALRLCVRATPDG